MIKFRRMRCARYVARKGKRSVIYRVLVRNSEGKMPLGRSKLRWEDNIEMDLQEVIWVHGLD
jgi:hypothetical protein